MLIERGAWGESFWAGEAGWQPPISQHWLMPESQPGWRDVVLGKFAGLSKTCCCHWLILCKIPNDIYLYSSFGFLCVPPTPLLHSTGTRASSHQKEENHLKDRQGPIKNKRHFAPEPLSALRLEPCQAVCSNSLGPRSSLLQMETVGGRAWWRKLSPHLRFHRWQRAAHSGVQRMFLSTLVESCWTGGFSS